MLIVVFDHCGFDLWSAADHLEVPAFFVASGFVYTVTDSFKTMLWSKVRRLLIPFFIFELLFVWLVGDTFPAENCFYRPSNQPLWFIKALFGVFLIDVMMEKLIEWKSVPWRAVTKCILAVLIGVISLRVTNRMFFTTGLRHAMMSLPLFTAGYALRCIFGRVHSVKVLAVIGCVSAAVWLLTSGREVNYSCLQESLPRFWVCSTCGFIVAYLAFKAVGRCGALEYVGRNSLVVYGIHYTIAQLLTPYIECSWLLFGVVLTLSLIIGRLFMFIPPFRSGATRGRRCCR
jgi:fucose 4-O-acetylase-like acetyltransferase